MELPVRTIVRVLLTVLLVAALVRLAPFLILLALAVLIAAALRPLVDWMIARGLKPWLAESLVAFFFVAATAAIFGILLPTVWEQISELITRMPELKADFESSIASETLRKYIHPYLDHPEKLTGNISEKLALVGSMFLGGVYTLLLVLILAIYLMIDGEKSYRWLTAFFNLPTQDKIERTITEIRPIVFAYVTGQAITSGIVAVYVFVSLQILHVPAALTLATIAAVCDVVPVIGFIISVISGILMALTVSTTTALIVVGIYVLYMILENYLVAPRVYGNKLKLSKLAVLLSILIGGQIAGIAGMILALPIVASYPVIERIWLRRHVRPEAIEVHAVADEELEKGQRT